MDTDHSTAVVWLRRDLRLCANPALAYACQQHERVVVAFILDDAGEGDRAAGAAGRAWLYHSLQALQADLRPCSHCRPICASATTNWCCAAATAASNCSN